MNVAAGGRRPLIIVGAGGLGRETLAAVRAIHHAETAERRARADHRGRAAPLLEPIGFVDDAASFAGTVVDGLPVLGPIEVLETMLRRRQAAAVIIATGRPGGTSSRRVLSDRLRRFGATFATVVHPTATLAIGTQVGEGSILLAGVVTTAPIAIGRHIVAMPQVVFTHDDVIGDFAMFATRATLSGAVRVGDGAYVGAGALVRENLSIGPRALVGMGAVVTHDVPADEVWVGNPARQLTDRPDDRPDDRPPNPGAPADPHIIDLAGAL